MRALFTPLAACLLATQLWTPAHASTVPIILSQVYTSQPVVALTFDDGPSLYTTPILTTLNHDHVPATFFVVGEHVLPFAADLRAELASGDTIGNHTYSHADLQWLSTPAVIAQLNATQAVVRQATGRTPHWFRPPYGAIDTRVASVAANLGLTSVTWSVDPADWSRPGVWSIVSRVLVHVRPGSIILLHDGGGDRSETLQALPFIIADLRARGYRFLTLDQLFGRSPLATPRPNHSPAVRSPPARVSCYYRSRECPPVRTTSRPPIRTPHPSRSRTASTATPNPRPSPCATPLSRWAARYRPCP